VPPELLEHGPVAEQAENPPSEASSTAAAAPPPAGPPQDMPLAVEDLAPTVVEEDAMDGLGPVEEEGGGGGVAEPLTFQALSAMAPGEALAAVAAEVKAELRQTATTTRNLLRALAQGMLRTAGRAQAAPRG